MPPPKKRSKATQNETPSPLLADFRVGWLVKSNENTVELVAKDETLFAHKDVLTRNSEYFERCLQEPWTESQKGSITFDDIEPKYLALFIGVAYSCSSIVPMQPPVSAENPQARSPKTPLQDYVEVYKLCDRFVCPNMAEFIAKCIYTAIGDDHRALYRSHNDDGQQKAIMRDFADAYEALETDHLVQKKLGEKMTEYFCEGVNYATWAECMDTVAGRHRFVAGVSRVFAKKLGSLQQAKKLRRKELGGPAP